MKKVTMFRNHDVRTSNHSMRAYRGGVTYPEVLEAHANAIVAAGAGEIVATEGQESEEKNAAIAPRPNKRNRRG